MIDSKWLTLVLDCVYFTLALLLLICVELYRWLALQDVLWLLTSLRLWTLWWGAFFIIVWLELSRNQKLWTATNMAHHSIIFTQKPLFIVICYVVMWQHMSWLLGHREAIIPRKTKLLLYFSLLELNEAFFLLHYRLTYEVFYLSKLFLEFFSLSFFAKHLGLAFKFALFLS